jgi:hypothetical protein
MPVGIPAEPENRHDLAAVLVTVDPVADLFDQSFNGLIAANSAYLEVTSTPASMPLVHFMSTAHCSCQGKPVLESVAMSGLD